jgi:long-subunit fatty acid transport protein
LGKGYYASLGYFFSEASTPEKDYTPLVPDIDLHVASIGFGYNGERWTWAVAGQLIGGDFRKIDEANNPVVNGSYRLSTPTVSFSIGHKF